MGKKSKTQSPYRPTLGRAERRVADALRKGGKVIFDRIAGRYAHPLDAAPYQLQPDQAARLIAKRVMAGAGDQMFGDVSQTWVFDQACLL